MGGRHKEPANCVCATGNLGELETKGNSVESQVKRTDERTERATGICSSSSVQTVIASDTRRDMMMMTDDDRELSSGRGAIYSSAIKTERGSMRRRQQQPTPLLLDDDDDDAFCFETKECKWPPNYYSL